MLGICISERKFLLWKLSRWWSAEISQVCKPQFRK